MNCGEITLPFKKQEWAISTKGNDKGKTTSQLIRLKKIQKREVEGERFVLQGPIHSLTRRQQVMQEQIGAIWF